MTIGLVGAFLGGLAVLFSPCSAMLLPSFFAYAFGEEKRRLVARTSAFYLGLVATLVPLGLGAGALGSLLGAHRRTLTLIGAAVLIALGLMTLLGMRLPTPGMRSPSGTGIVAVVAMGAVYGLAGACTGPLLGAVLTFAAVQASPLYGAVLLALFAAGMVVPLLVLAWLWDGLDLGRRLKPRPVRLGPLRTSLWGLLSGTLMIGLGVLFLATDATGKLIGVLDARQQFDLEVRLGRWAEGVPDSAVLISLVGLGIWLGWSQWRRGRLRGR